MFNYSDYLNFLDTIGTLIDFVKILMDTYIHWRACGALALFFLRYFTHDKRKSVCVLKKILTWIGGVNLSV